MDQPTMKYAEQAVSRYASYPTPEYWIDKINIDDWKNCIAREFDLRNHTEGICLNIQLPFCERVCSSCACKNKINTNNDAEEQYIETLKKEWGLYRKLMKQTPVIRQIYIGGSKPIFFSPANLKKTIQVLTRDCILHPNHVFSIECDPNNITVDYLQVLAETGFRRINYTMQQESFGSSDMLKLDQVFDQVQAAVINARSYGFKSVNIELIPAFSTQGNSNFTTTVNRLARLLPDRIVLNDMNHLPGSKQSEMSADNLRIYTEILHQLYRDTKQLLTDAGYFHIGLNHFTRAEDPLYEAFLQKTVHRSLTGYEVSNRGLMIGLGVAAISDIGISYAQNSDTLNEYRSKVEGYQPGVQRVCFLTEEDKAIRNYIMDICCKQITTIHPEHISLLEQYTFPLLRQMHLDGLLTFDGTSIELSHTGQEYIEQICSSFDLHRHRREVKLSNTSSNFVV